MKNLRIIILGVALITKTAITAPQVIDKIAVIVNNDVILESDINNMMYSIKEQVQQSGKKILDDRTFRRQVIERLIIDCIILQISKQMDVHISDKQLDLAIANIAEQNNMTISQMRNYLSYSGKNYNTYREQIRKDILIAEVRNNEIRRRITILPHEVESLAKQIASQNNLSTELNITHILIPIPKNQTQQQVFIKEQLINKLVNELKKGTNLSDLSVKYSIDSQTLNGNNMGWSKIEELPNIFASALSTAKKGDFIGPIHSDVGFHILKVNDLRSKNQNIYVTEMHLRHILIKPSPIMTDDQAHQKIIQIANDIKSIKISFAVAAKQFSDDLESANQGGDLGWNSPEIYDQSFRNALLHLRKGEISQPVHSNLGWHLIQLLDTRNVDKTDAVQNGHAYRLLFNRKFAEEAQIWLNNQRANAYVKIIDDHAK